MSAAALPTEEQILARFHRLRITIGLSATKFGYATIGQPGLIKRIESGHKLRAKTRRICGDALDTLEREHSVPFPQREQNENKMFDGIGNVVLDQRNKPTIPAAGRSELED